MCDTINQQQHLTITNSNLNCLNNQMAALQHTNERIPIAMMPTIKKTHSKAIFANNINNEEEEEQQQHYNFIQETQDTTSQIMSDVSTVDGEEEDLSYIASEILSEKRTYYYQVKKQVIKRLSLGTRQTENTKQKRWSQTEETLFWNLLSKYGTNFEFVAKEIKTKTRKQVMLKFNREDKKNAVQVDQALKGILPACITAVPETD